MRRRTYLAHVKGTRHRATTRASLRLATACEQRQAGPPESIPSDATRFLRAPQTFRLPETMIDLDVRVEGAAALPFAAQPTLALKLRIGLPSDVVVVRSISLTVQVRIAAPQRAYT